MAANTVPGIARLEQARSRIGHQEPSFLIREDMFNKTGNGNGNTYEHNKTLVQQARATGWVPSQDFYGSDDNDETWATHIVLQDFGVGVGHALYGEMLRKFAPDKHSHLNKGRLASHFGLKAHSSIGHKDLLTMAILTHIAQRHYEDHGETQMMVEEARRLGEVNAQIDERMREEEELRASYREHRMPPKRKLPFDEGPKPAKARRVARGGAAVTSERSDPLQDPTPSSGSPAAPDLRGLFVSSMSRQIPPATPRSVPSTPSTPRPTTTFRRLLYARDNARDEDEDDEALDAPHEFNPF